MWQTVSDLCRSFGAVFKVGKSKHSKCPRCKGSGLMFTMRPSHQEQGHMSNEPCWFCEGVGVLPIIGLNGFLLARASSLVNTFDLKVHAFSPAWLEPSLGTYTGTSCKVLTSKPAEQMSNYIFQVAKTPPWYAELEREVELSSTVLLANHALSGMLDGVSNTTLQVKNETSSLFGWTSILSSSKTPYKSHSATSNFIGQGAPDIRHKASDSSVFSTGVQPKPGFASFVVTECNYKFGQWNKGKNVGQEDKEIKTSKHPCLSASFGCIPGLDVFLIVSAVKLAIQEKSLCRLGTNPSKNSLSTESERRASIQLGRVMPTITSATKHRNVRRGKNRIREKAQKEAKEKARRILKCLTPRESHVSSALSNEIPEGVLSLVSMEGNGDMEKHG